MQPAHERPRPTDLFIRKPVLAMVICLAIILLGLQSVSKIPVLQFPKLESTSLVINTPYVGASAEVVQGFITDPVERVLSTIPGVDYVESTTVAGMSVVTVWLLINQDSIEALTEVSARLDQIKFELPEAAEDPFITIRRADRPYATFYLQTVFDDRLTRAQVSDFVQRNINPVMALIKGVRDVELMGHRLPAMRIWLEPDRMASFNVNAQHVQQALVSNNIIATIGQSENRDQRINLLVNTSLSSVEEFKEIVIREDDDVLVKIRDIARVALGEEEGQSLARENNNNVIFLGIYTEPGYNELEVGDNIYETMAMLQDDLPPGMEIRMANDATRYMRDALKEIFTTLAETILLVGLVVVAFMGSFRTAMVPLVTIPISILGAVAAISLMGFSLNLLTVLAIVLSVGLVVDDAIVVVENVARHMRNGMTATEAAIKSSRQLFTPIISMTITLAAVYVPIGFLSGLTGALFKEFAFTLATAVLISGLVALTLSPVMSSWVCPEGGQEGRITRLVNHWFGRAERLYGSLLNGTLKSVPQIIFMGIFFSLLIIPMFLLSQQELAPIEDEANIRFIINAPPEASLDYTEKHLTEVVDAMNALPGATRMWQVVSPSGGFAGQSFSDFDDREFSTQELLGRAYGAASQYTGLQVVPVLFPPLPTAGNFGVDLVVLSTDNTTQMLPYAEQLKQLAIESGLFMTADKDLQIDLPQGQFYLDRERVADLNMDLADVSRQIGLLLSGNYVNRFELDGKAYKVIPMLEKNQRADPDALMDLEIMTPDGTVIPLSSVATMEKKVSPRFLRKFQQKNAFRIFGVIRPGVTKEQGLAFLEEKAAEMLPAHYSIDYAGESRQIRQEGNTLIGVLGIALVFVFFVLTIQFNSFRDPLIVLLGSVPLALAGATFISFMGWTTVNIYSQVGFITLVGLVSKNAILIVEFANQLQFSGLQKPEAIRQAATIRLRPVLMTTGATALGHFPLVLVTGSGAEARNSIGIILVAGMLIGTFFTLFVLPSIYYLLAADHNAEKEIDLGDMPVTSGI